MDTILTQADEIQRMDEPWGSLTWLAGANLANAEGLTLGRVVIRRGGENPRHGHLNCEEVLYLLAGELEHTFGDRVVRMRAGDVLRVPAGVFHNARSVGEVDADMMVAYSSARRDFVPERQ